MAKIPISLQTFTVRDDVAKDFKGTIEQIAKIGYKGIEIGGDVGGMTGKELRKFLDGLGLAVSGCHTSIDIISKDIRPAIDFALELGNKWIVCPYLPKEWRENADDWKKMAKILEDAGRRCEEAGLKILYHNHDFEFTKFDGKYGLDILYENSDPRLVQAELDTYWIKRGGEEPVDYIRKYKNRVPLVHLKDMTADESHTFAEIGEGMLDIEGIFAVAKEAGAEWMVVEQDACKRPPLESVRISFENLKKMGFA